MDVCVLISELYTVALLTGIAFYQRWLFKNNKPFSHSLWLIIFCLLSYPPVWFFTKNPLALGAVFLIREVYFSPFLNLIRGHKFFYTNTTDPNGSQLDKEEGKELKVFYFASVAGLITLQFFL